MNDSRPSLSVVIPTYQRPDWIRRAVHSLAIQHPAPMEVIAVSRDTDLPTHASIAELQREPLPFPLKRELVSDPGFIPPVKLGLSVAGGDIIAVMDDDAEATESWTDRLLRPYADSSVGAVGGRYINSSEEGPTPVPDVDRVGYVNRRGQFIGNLYCNPRFTQPIDVSFMIGGNMSFRREVAQRLEFDMELNRNVADGYEVDVGLQVRRMGWRIVFDPLLAVRHYSAPRATVGLRQSNRESIQWYAFNQTRVALRRLPPVHRSVALAYQLAMGERRAPGLLPLAAGRLARKAGFELEMAGPALKGRFMAMKSVLRPEPPRP
jgi:GT2 family glycosyltransferase